MSRRLDGLTDAELEGVLRDLGASLADPQPHVDLALAARVRIQAGEPRRGWRLAGQLPPLRRALVLATLGLLILAGLAAAIGFGLPGLRIILLGPSASPPAVATPPSLGGLDLGRPVEVDALDGAAGFDARVPTLAGLGPPIGVFVEDRPRGNVVNVAYPPSSAYPAPPGAAVAVLVNQLEARLDGESFAKLLPAGTDLVRVTVNGSPGYWISGAPHQVAYLDVGGELITESIRVAGNVLVWSDGGITYRIEGAPNLASALRIAASMR